MYLVRSMTLPVTLSLRARLQGLIGTHGSAKIKDEGHLPTT